jgi:uridine phosphorylase
MLQKKTVDSSVPIQSSELILNPDGSIYHLKLKPEQLGDKIILAGDPGRVEIISSYFSKIESKTSNREFVTHTGIFNGQRISAISTGIGIDNIDIVINELDALVNIDLQTRLIKKEKKVLDLVRIGTSGALQEDIPVDSFVASTYGLGMDGLLNYYENEASHDEQQLAEKFLEDTEWPSHFNKPYFAKGNSNLLDKVGKDMHHGITATANGFYGPQGRILRLALYKNNLNETLRSFIYNNNRILNFEMETSALYGLSALLGHNACTVCAIVANRFRKEYSKDYHPVVKQLIVNTLERLTN